MRGFGNAKKVLFASCLLPNNSSLLNCLVLFAVNTQGHDLHFCRFTIACISPFRPFAGSPVFSFSPIFSLASDSAVSTSCLSGCSCSAPYPTNPRSSIGPPARMSTGGISTILARAPSPDSVLQSIEYLSGKLTRAARQLDRIQKLDTGKLASRQFILSGKFARSRMRN